MAECAWQTPVMPRRDRRRSARLAGSALCLLAAGLLSACGRNDQKVDPATVDAGAYRKPVVSDTPVGSEPVPLPGGATAMAAPVVAEIQSYLASSEAAGRSFELGFVSFVKGEQIREDPNGSFAALGALLRTHPNVKVRAEVRHPNIDQPGPSGEAQTRAELVAKQLVMNGAPAAQVEAAGVKGGEPTDVSKAFLTVVQK